jgi:succinate dehydrogenase / fumarate reductase cytochrome b subunit
MTEKTRTSSLGNIAKWFDPRGRQPGTWAFILNRVTGLGLTFYLYLHLIVLGRLAQGPEAYDSFVALAKSPIFVFGEFLVVAAAIYHGLNGIRVALNSFGFVIPRQRQLFYGVAFVAVIGFVIFGIRMFTV